MKHRFISLKFKMLLVTLASIILAIGIFVGLYTLGNFLVWKYYMDDKMVEDRRVEYIEDFQAYVKSNNLYTTDMWVIKDWSGSRFMELVIYKDDQLIYYPGWGEQETEDATTGEETESITESPSELASEDETEPPEYVYGEGRDFRDYMNEDTRREYENTLSEILAGNRELSPVVFKDGTLLVTVVDYSANFMYSAVMVSSLIFAIIVMIIIMIIAFSRLTMRITRLAADVNRLERELVQIPIKSGGVDEITTLAEDINAMRNAIVTNMRKEQQAWEANAGLITAMSHDIRTPLTVLLGYIDLLELQAEDETTREYLAACRENAIKLKKLSDDMFGYFLVFGKREVQLDYACCSASEVINHMLDEHIILLCEKGYDVRKSSEELEGEICVDLMYFGRVVDNIFSNINKYADMGSPVEIGFSAHDGKVRLEFINKISLSERVESSGIGIKTSAKIMEQMNGSFSSSSDRETFTVMLELPLKK